MTRVKKGNRVILVKARSAPSPQIPLWGSKYECVGTVMNNSRSHARIKWDDGQQSSFLIYKVELYNEEAGAIEPNRSFLLRKRKKMG